MNSYLQRTAQMACKLGSWLGVSRRIADNTFGKVIPRLRVSQLVGCLHRMVKAEHRRGNLEPSHLSVGAVAMLQLCSTIMQTEAFDRV